MTVGGDASRRVTIVGPHDLRLEAVDVADPEPGEARLRPLAIGICGSDLHVLAGQHPFVDYPVASGHELAAEVVAVGDDTDAAWIGARVVLEPSLVCGECRNCLAGRYNICDDLRVMGFQASGGMADAFNAPIDRLHRLPDGLADREGALVEPVAVATHAVRLAKQVAAGFDGAQVAVVGAGTIGMLCAQVARAAGSDVTITDVDAERRGIARSFGFTTRQHLDERAFDVVFECVGNEGALRSSVAGLRKGGTVIVVGVYGSDPKVQAGWIQDRELRLVGSLMYTSEDYREAIQLLTDGAIDARRMITSEHSLAHVAQAFEIAGTGGASLKVLLRP